MISALQRVFDNFAGRGDAAVTVPPMDGALRPNNALEEAALIEVAQAPDNLVQYDGQIWYSTGATLQAIGGASRSYEAPISCVASDGHGRLAVGMEDGRIALEQGGVRVAVLEELGERRIFCPVALSFDQDDLLLCEGSRAHGPRGWQRDLMQRGSAGRGSGSVWRIPASGKPVCLADDLAWPYGVLPAEDGGVIVSEAWRHRLLRLGAAGPQTVLADLPGYPARLCPAWGGGTWLAVFAPRSQLIEFVLREPGYRRRMMAEVPMEYWIAPALHSGRSFLEPLQGGAVKMMGILKPWAPTRSYGLVLKLDAAFAPVASLHSRADGSRHGITSLLAHGGRLSATAKGGDAIIEVDASATGTVLQ